MNSTKQCELRIHDEHKDQPGFLIPFGSFLQTLCCVLNRELAGKWRIFHGAEGYGEKVCSITDSLMTQDSVIIDAAEIVPVLLSGEEYFDNVRIQPVGGDIEFGVFDSTFCFVRGCHELLEKVAAHFTHSQIVE